MATTNPADTNEEVLKLFLLNLNDLDFDIHRKHRVEESRIERDDLIVALREV